MGFSQGNFKWCTPKCTVLDIGCGDARKIIPLASHVNHIFAIEPSPEMRALADRLIKNSDSSNITLIDGYADKLPFADASCEIVTCTLAPWDSKEVYRVLKPGGYFINEMIGPCDKLEFKKEFGKDENNNWRGQSMQLNEMEYLKKVRNDLEPKLSIINIENGFWNTYYTKQGLLDLCQYTPTIKDFNSAEDCLNFDRAVLKLGTTNGIKIQQNRLLVIAVKN